jgi:alkylation response protein AidB-like acyl-CoA dehydrogenase
LPGPSSPSTIDSDERNREDCEDFHGRWQARCRNDTGRAGGDCRGRRDLAPEFDKVGEQADKDNQFPFELVPLYKDAKLPGIGVPKRFGGGGADIWTLTRISHELAEGDPACALACVSHHAQAAVAEHLAR